MINRTVVLRSLIVAMFFAMLTVAATQNAAAQWPCKCGAVYISASNDIRCDFKLCVESALGTECTAVGPGTFTKLPCAKDTYIWVYDCHGNKAYIKANCDLHQTQVIAISPDCCIEACVTTDSQGCLVVKIWGHSAPCDKC